MFSLIASNEFSRLWEPIRSYKIIFVYFFLAEKVAHIQNLGIRENMLWAADQNIYDYIFCNPCNMFRRLHCDWEKLLYIEGEEAKMKFERFELSANLTLTTSTSIWVPIRGSN